MKIFKKRFQSSKKSERQLVRTMRLLGDENRFKIFKLLTQEHRPFGPLVSATFAKGHESIIIGGTDMKITEQKEGDIFNVDTEVLSNGIYVCVPCGDKQYFQNGEIFPRCFNCIDQEGNPEKLRKGLGLWELLKSTEGPVYECSECNLHYRDNKNAKSCELWCRKTKTCNIEITRCSVEAEV